MANETKEISIPAPETVSGWGMFKKSDSPVLKPSSEEEILDILAYASRKKIKTAFRGSGFSYGDPAINEKGIIVDLSGFNKILDFNESTGVITVQAGVTIKQIWEHTVEKGWWPPVVSGTMFPTLGGALSMNIHGKNNFAVGPIGEHVTGFSFITPGGKILEATPKKNSELFYSAISGFGMLGCFSVIKLKLKKVYSGKMKVTAVSTANLKEMIDYFDKNHKTSDYLVGWIDAFPGGDGDGRGLIHRADHYKNGEDKNFPENASLKKQHLPSTLFGIIPKSIMWLFLYPFTNNLGMRLINTVKFILGKLEHGKVYDQGHAEFQFLLDYVPGWKNVYKPGSLIQYQLFMPAENALRGFSKLFAACRKAGIVSYLAVFKRHRPDKFLMTHAVDGYSMALDFPVTAKNREKLDKLVEIMDDIAVEYGARFYFAKDATLRPVIAKKVFGEPTLKKFRALKKKYDPNNILESDLFRRVFK